MIIIIRREWSEEVDAVLDPIFVDDTLVSQEEDAHPTQPIHVGVVLPVSPKERMNHLHCG